MDVYNHAGILFSDIFKEFTGSEFKEKYPRRYFKVTNSDENHQGLQYHTGIIKDFQDFSPMDVVVNVVSIYHMRIISVHFLIMEYIYEELIFLMNLKYTSKMVKLKLMLLNLVHE